MNKEIQKGVWKHIETTAKKVDSDAKQNLWKEAGTSDWKLLIQLTTIELQRNKLRAKVVNKHKAAKFIEFGTRPHIIRAKNKPFLAFNVANSGSLVTRKTNKSFVMVKQVHHPGTQPHPFMRPAARSNQNFYIRGMKKIINAKSSR